MSNPSPEAVEFVGSAIHGYACGCDRPWPTNVNYPEIAQAAAEAAHDPDLGLDRSVCLRDVVEFLRARVPMCATREAAYFNGKLADVIEREFTKDDLSRTLDTTQESV